MEQLSEAMIDEAINHLITKLNPSAGIKDVYPNQRRLLHEFFRGQDIFYTGMDI